MYPRRTFLSALLTSAPSRNHHANHYPRTDDSEILANFIF
jgi:hypothetical protein